MSAAAVEVNRLVVGISGASGARLGISFLRALRELSDWESHLVITSGGERTIELEAGATAEDVAELADKFHSNDDLGASIASGTYRTAGMAVIPCSMKTVSGIACGYADNLLLRAADVTIKEGRTLILVVRESPFSAIHLENMLKLARLGVVIMPAVFSCYNKPQSVEDIMEQIVGKILDRFGIETKYLRRWEGD